jgi:hypothetical protein
MKYWFIGIGVILATIFVLGIASSLRNSDGYMSTLPMSESDERKDCLLVLNEYAPKHPDDLKCSMQEIQSAAEGGDKVYSFTSPDGTTLTIDTYEHTAVLTDKNGKLLESQ